MSKLQTIIHQLAVMRRRVDVPYYVPGLWVDFTTTDAVLVDPYTFYQSRLQAILDHPPTPLLEGWGGEWTRRALVYNLFPRYTTAFDHNDDDQLQLGVNPDGWRETGTLLKCIAILPFLNYMGFNTVHLLPITTIGQDGRKGNLGSPYAIRNPYEIDPELVDPALDMSADDLFEAFVEAAHRLGMRVVMEFVLRTASKDSDWVRDHPHWFYWIRADIRDRTAHTGRTDMLRTFGQPRFTNEALGIIHWKVGQGDFNDLPAPDALYREMYTASPAPDRVYLEGGRWIGVLEDGTRVRIPGAFADFPPNDSQPPWSDVTYLRLYDHPDFNYMAYNTLRMYDTRLTNNEHGHDHRIHDLWDAIAGVIPHYQRRFGIDGVLIDMGHALPMPLKERIVAEARGINPDFAFWDENFTPSATSRAEGYNAVVGYWLLGMHEGFSVRNYVEEISRAAYPVACFAASENHNTPRSFARFGGVAYAHYTLALSVMLPGVVFILSGFELGETFPMNTGLGFSAEYAAAYPPETLPLFSARRMDWTRATNYVRSIRQALDIRRRYVDLLSDPDPKTIRVGASENPAILVFSRQKNYPGQPILSVIANTDMGHQQGGRVILRGEIQRVPGLWGVQNDVGMDIAHETTVNVGLIPGYVLIIESGRTL
ncbi:MAG TPA: alpha-amylase family glycosyl hydrolase [Aggregatilineales bacterium]|nr:alpha-amylase [Anaerolineales bacterium]HRE48854.1 alpha-amylase family glycosyl hydrolase [Aggregatilineales bacterium]